MFLRTERSSAQKLKTAEGKCGGEWTYSHEGSDVLEIFVPERPHSNQPRTAGKAHRSKRNTIPDNHRPTAFAPVMTIQGPSVQPQQTLCRSRTDEPHFW